MELIQNVLEFWNLNPSFNLNKLEREIVLTIWINSLRAKNRDKRLSRHCCSVRWICIVFKYLLFLELFPIKSFLFSCPLTVFFIIYLDKTPDDSCQTVGYTILKIIAPPRFSLSVVRKSSAEIRGERIFKFK